MGQALQEARSHGLASGSCGIVGYMTANRQIQARLINDGEGDDLLLIDIPDETVDPFVYAAEVIQGIEGASAHKGLDLTLLPDCYEQWGVPA